MRIKVLIKDSMEKTYKVLPVVKDNHFLEESKDLIEKYNDANWRKVFTKAYDDFYKGKFKRIIIIDDYAYGPFLFFSKMKGQVATTAFDEYSAYLSRAHNNTKVCIIPLLRTEPAKLNNIINAFCVAEFEAGRHCTRLQIIHGGISATTTKAIKFSSKPTKTVVIGSDHAGFTLKEVVKDHLIEKGYKVIDVGTNSLDSTHYSLYGIAMTKHYAQASYAIGLCWTGMGIANTLNKFKGIRACVCMTPDNAKIARQVYGVNTLVMGAKFSTKAEALKTVDTHLQTKPKANPTYAFIDDLGFALDQKKFKAIKIEKTIDLPIDLK